ncbi:bacterio-opsin activator [Halostagnicola larsenii XH-48]|uniref:Bacterio-opsin activator n=1 Tax=Halostagnicola larsenii XH-48 TaxID=797299 RepID=W0JR10_9EURY|nr:helix-turn-helix domain-containing protein [Halostagnicola larsenii]AHF99609.1 bacterio-opsin activator [Halostagnicola larsenii XH-48]
MTTIAEITITAADFALADTCQSNPDLELRVESVAGEGKHPMTLVWFSSCDREAVESALADDSTVTDFKQLLTSSDGTERLYRLEYDSNVTERCECVFEYDGSILDAKVSDGQWTLRLLFPRRESLSSAIEAIEGFDVTVDVRRMVEADRNADLEASAALTEPQREAIAEAYRQGYYDVPREISLEELARELNISHQALSERLRRANRVLAGEQLNQPRGEIIRN